MVLVWVSRAGQEMGPGSKAGGKMEVGLLCVAVGWALKWRLQCGSSGGFGSEKNGLRTELQLEAEEEVELSESVAGSERTELLSDPGSGAESWPRAELLSGNETVCVLVALEMGGEQGPKPVDGCEAECGTEPVVEYGHAVKPA